MLKLDFPRITEALVHLERSGSSIFGADAHHFRMNPKLDEADAAAFEQIHCVSLPDDFRDFLTSLGNGGAGPFYGVFPLGKMDDNFELRDWRQDDVGLLCEPFPFTEGWNDLSAKPADDRVDQDDSEYWKQMEAFETSYFGTATVNGAFPICHQGCALRILLVVTGNQAGYLWDDRRSEYAGLTPIRLANGSPATFCGWYEEWLKSCLEIAKLLGHIDSI